MADDFGGDDATGDVDGSKTAGGVDGADGVGGVDGDDGAADVDGDDASHVVTVFLRNDGEVLLLRRSDEVGTYAGRWGAVAGYAEGAPDDAARWEIDEETGLAEAVTLVRAGDPFTFTDESVGTRWTVHPYLFDCDSRDVETNRESAAAAWVPPTELLRRETVPRLWTSYDRVRPTVESVAGDDVHGSAYVSVRALEVLRDEAGHLAYASDGGEGVRSEAGDAGATGDWETLAETAELLRDARPSMTALANRVNRVMARVDRTAASVEREARVAVGDALAADREAAERAKRLVAGDAVLTLSRSGTVADVLSDAPSSVVVGESRPAREGVGVAERLADAGADVTLVTDAAVAHVLATDDVDAVVVGADTVLPDGSVVNKTGTRSAALAAASEGVPTYAVTAADKVATASEVELESGPAEAVYDGDADLAVLNPTFDLTPAEFVTGVVTERGVLDEADVREVAAEFRALADWR
jgi:translation initiation factor 2B subunit (eIF-2B alpha/beta/delta family)